jgi:hypothetical protein
VSLPGLKRQVIGIDWYCGSDAGSGNIRIWMPRSHRILLMVGLAILAAGCGTPSKPTIEGSSTTNGGVVPIGQSGTYAYTVTIPTPGPPQLPTDCNGANLVLSDESGTAESLGKTGTLYFKAGNWTGSLDGTNTLGCEWKVMLTPS